jgi:alkyl hydroperoxide reductase subunit AhpC
MTFPVLLDTKGEVAREYSIRGTPAHFLINKNGMVKAFSIGFKDLGSKTSQNLIRFMIENNN